jgi:hypothetical protein
VHLLYYFRRPLDQDTLLKNLYTPFVLAFGFMLLFGSCNLINPEESVPSYIRIDEFSFVAAPGEGTDSEKITEVWVYSNGEMLGAFDLPADIPVLDEGATQIKIFAGIKNNGISSSRIRYPFYTTFDTTLQCVPGAEFLIKPRFFYRDDISIEEYNFESGQNQFISVIGSDVDLDVIINSDQVFEGGGSGYALLDNGNNQLLVRTNQELVLTPGKVTFLELNYSTNNTLAAGLYSFQSTTEKKNLALLMNPTTETVGAPVWNKIYIDLGLIPSQNINADEFEIYFEAVADTPGKTVEVFLDNVKLVTFD